MATDPICGMYVAEGADALNLFRDNRLYYFCSTTCQLQFAEPGQELARLRRRLAVAWPASLAVVVLTYLTPFALWPWAALVVAGVVQFYAGLAFYRGTWDALRSRLGNMDVLIAIGTTAAYLYSGAVLFLPGRLPAAYYFDASALIVTLILSGNYLEHLTRDRATGALRRLRELLPATARVVRDGREVEVPVAEVAPGAIVRVRPGERFATDATVRRGATTVDEALLTGESTPVAKPPGSRVLAGSVNGEGAVDVEATRVGEDTFLAEVGRLMTEAETSRVPLQRLADRIAAAFVPAILLLALLAAAGWYALSAAGLTVALLVFVSVAITACPCAFGIATPAAIVVGTGRAAEAGILFKGHDALERAARVDVVLTDKTGTITEGRPSLVAVGAAPGITEADVLARAASVEASSEHPLARAVVAAARERRVEGPSAEGVVARPGEGVEGRVGGRRVEVITAEAARRAGIDVGPFAATAPTEARGRSLSFVVEDGQVRGWLAFQDRIAPGVADAVRELHADGMRVVMVTGDREEAARDVAAAVGIDEVHAGATPAGKLAILRSYQQAGRRVAYVGDGINDAAALLAADVGVAIGAGTDVAREAGQVILVRSDFAGVPLGLRLARRTVAKVRQNLAWALGYNAVLLPIAAGALVPLLGFGVYAVLPITGAVAMGLSSTSVVLNSFSLRWVRLGRSAPVGSPRAGAAA